MEKAKDACNKIPRSEHSQKILVNLMILLAKDLVSEKRLFSFIKKPTYSHVDDTCLAISRFNGVSLSK
ncbi:MAG: hypothetical protein Tsb005_00470 [Gammaproteobacteria bacterium]